MTRDDIFDLIHDERARQAEKWGGRHDWGRGDCSSNQVSPEVKVMVLAEETGEVARVILDCGGLVLDEAVDDLRAELVQVAAVAVAWLESMEPAA